MIAERTDRGAGLARWMPAWSLVLNDVRGEPNEGSCSSRKRISVLGRADWGSALTVVALLTGASRARVS